MTPEEIKKINDEFDKAYDEKYPQLHRFGIAPMKAEGRMVDFGLLDGHAPSKPQVDTTWIEFPLPREWAEECENMIEKWLEEKTAATKLDWS
jgi:hypothetical protein